MRITALAIIVLVCALAAVGLFVNHTADADGHGCPSDWPAPQGAASSGQASIDYNDFHTDGDGERWFVIRSTDSNGYTTIRAYVADAGLRRRLPRRVARRDLLPHGAPLRGRRGRRQACPDSVPKGAGAGTRKPALRR